MAEFDKQIPYSVVARRVCLDVGKRKLSGGERAHIGEMLYLCRENTHYL